MSITARLARARRLKREADAKANRTTAAILKARPICCSYKAKPTGGAYFIPTVITVAVILIAVILGTK